MKVEVNEVTRLRLVEQVARMKASERHHMQVMADANEKITTLVEASITDAEGYDPERLDGIDLNTLKDGFVTLRIMEPEPA